MKHFLRIIVAVALLVTPTKSANNDGLSAQVTQSAALSSAHGSAAWPAQPGGRAGGGEPVRERPAPRP